MKVKVNHINVVIYDNKPTLPANQWYEPNPAKEEYTSRFNFEINLLGQFEPVKLRCALIWPPSQLRRYDYWQKNSALFESWIDRAKLIQSETRAGRIKSSLPALIGIPNQNERFIGKKGVRFNWQVPVIPSLILAVQEQTATEKFWNITWLSAAGETIFVLDSTSKIATVENKKHQPTSTRISKEYSQPGEFESGLFLQTQSTKVVKKADDGYLDFKREVEYLLGQVDTQLSKMQAQVLLSKNPEWTKRLMAESGN